MCPWRAQRWACSTSSTSPQTITKQTEFAGQRLDVETLAFVALLFWVGSYTMSRESQRLERKLGVGTR